MTTCFRKAFSFSYPYVSFTNYCLFFFLGGGGGASFFCGGGASFQFGFKDGVWDSIVLIPDYFLSFNFAVPWLRPSNRKTVWKRPHCTEQGGHDCFLGTF